MPAMVMEHIVDPKTTLLKEIGDLSKIEIFNNQILVGVYVRPEKTKSGLFLAPSTREEDKWQGKVGLVLKQGANAFVDDKGKWFKDVKISNGDWLIFRPSDGWQITVNNVLCRILEDVDVRGRIDHPDTAW